MASSPSSSTTTSCGSTFSSSSLPINSSFNLPLNDTILDNIANRYPELGDSFASKFRDLRTRIDGQIASDSEEDEETPRFATIVDSPLLYKGLATASRATTGMVAVRKPSGAAGNPLERTSAALLHKKETAVKLGLINPSVAQPNSGRNLTGKSSVLGDQVTEGMSEDPDAGDRKVAQAETRVGGGGKLGFSRNPSFEDIGLGADTLMGAQDKAGYVAGAPGLCADMDRVGAGVPEPDAAVFAAAGASGSNLNVLGHGAGMIGPADDKEAHNTFQAEPTPQHPLLRSKKVNMFYIAPERVDGNILVKPTIDEALLGAKRWELTLVGYFIEKRMPFKEVRDYFVDQWNNLVGVRASRSGVFFFSFRDEVSMTSVLEGGPWMFGGHTLFLQRWKEGLQVDRFSHKEVPIWVRFTNVPTEYWTLKGMSRIASAVGVPMYPDETTINATRIDFARICIMMNVHSKFEEEIFLVLPGEDDDVTKARRITVEYEWKPKVCEACHSFGHMGRMCPLKIRATQGKKPIQVYVPRPLAPIDKGKKVEDNQEVDNFVSKDLTVATSNPFAVLEEGGDTENEVIDNSEFPTIKDGLAQKKPKGDTSPIVSLVEDIERRKKLGPISGINQLKDANHKGQLPPIKLVPDKGKKGSNSKKKSVAFEC